ncbi:hypothetical protein ACIBN2_43805, partial [Streptomyces sp. NPDC050534]
QQQTHGFHLITALETVHIPPYEVAHDHLYADKGYASQWGRPFPRAELEALRAALHTIRDGHRPHPMDGTPRA